VGHTCSSPSPAIPICAPDNPGNVGEIRKVELRMLMRQGDRTKPLQVEMESDVLGV
jgi:hypothetical protein